MLLNIDNLLLRGCCLKQTKSVLGIAVYVGHNTKIMKNIPNQSQKFSRIEKKLQKLIIIILIVQLIFSKFQLALYKSIFPVNKNSKLITIYKLIF